jgi:hypothetical protein
LYCIELVEGYDCWLRNAFLIIPQTAAIGDVAFGVAEEREGEIEFLYHRGVTTRRVDADAREPNPALLELLVIPGKADQLPIAVRSPVASVEDKHQGTLGKFTAQIEGLFLLVR